MEVLKNAHDFGLESGDGADDFLVLGGDNEANRGLVAEDVLGEGLEVVLEMGCESLGDGFCRIDEGRFG